jgi:hypothetical protein
LVGKIQDGVDTFATRFFNECTRVDDNNIGLRHIVGLRVALRNEQTHNFF